MLPDIGTVAEHRFTIDQAAMEIFATLSGDNSAVHVSDDCARNHGYRGAIVYGGLMLAHLSYVMGNQIPGDKGVSMQWSIDYRNALYVGEPATLRLEVVHVSEATNIISSKFTIYAGDRLVATGKTQSLLLQNRAGL